MSSKSDSEVDSFDQNEEKEYDDDESIDAKDLFFTSPNCYDLVSIVNDFADADRQVIHHNDNEITVITTNTEQHNYELKEDYEEFENLPLKFVHWVEKRDERTFHLAKHSTTFNIVQVEAEDDDDDEDDEEEEVEEDDLDKLIRGVIADVKEGKFGVPLEESQQEDDSQEMTEEEEYEDEEEEDEDEEMFQDGLEGVANTESNKAKINESNDSFDHKLNGVDQQVFETDAVPENGFYETQNSASFADEKEEMEEELAKEKEEEMSPDASLNNAIVNGHCRGSSEPPIETRDTPRLRPRKLSQSSPRNSSQKRPSAFFEETFTTSRLRPRLHSAQTRPSTSYQESEKFDEGEYVQRSRSNATPQRRQSQQKSHSSVGSGKVYICEYAKCSFTTHRKDMLTRHQRSSIHSRDKPFSCTWGDGCTFASARKDHVGEHVRKMHLQANSLKEKMAKRKTAARSTNPYDFVKKNAASVNIPKKKTKAKANSSVATPTATISGADGRFCCQYPPCKYKAYSRPEVRSHELRIHKKMRPYRCVWPDCAGYSSAQKSHVARHIRSNHFGIAQSQQGLTRASTLGNRKKATKADNPYDYIETDETLLQ